MRVIKGSCHCDNIVYELGWPDESDTIPARSCSCDFCMKHRGTYTSHPEARLDVRIEDRGQINRYRFATATAEFFVCKRCGAVPFVTSEIEGTVFAVVNVNTLDAVDPKALDSSVTNFDGELREDRLARRSRTWIRNVTISNG